MGQILHGNTMTTHSVRAELERSKVPSKELAKRYENNAKWLGNADHGQALATHRRDR